MKGVRVLKHVAPCGKEGWVVEVRSVISGEWLMTEDCYPTKKGALKAMKRWEE